MYFHLDDNAMIKHNVFKWWLQGHKKPRLSLGGPRRGVKTEPKPKFSLES